MDRRQSGDVDDFIDLDRCPILPQASERPGRHSARAIDDPHSRAWPEPPHANVVRLALTQLRECARLQPRLAEEGRYAGRATAVQTVTVQAGQATQVNSCGRRRGARSGSAAASSPTRGRAASTESAGGSMASGGAGR